MEPPQGGTPQESLDRLRLEVEELRASRGRLVAANDADRRRLERDLHDGPQQHLIALAVNLQLARQLADADPTAAKALLEEMGRRGPVGARRDGEARASDLPALLGRRRPGGGAARGGGDHRRADATSTSEPARATRPRSPGRSTSAVSTRWRPPAKECARRSTSATKMTQLVFDVLEQGAGLALPP